LRFASALKHAGAPVRLPRGADPSLPLALGGAGTTLRDMTALYGTIADQGRALPLRLVPGEAPEAQQALERRAADAVAAILVQNFPGGGPRGVAWKTGTSWGGRDAWAMGFDTRHVAGVWVGRPDGTAMPGATGRQVALPVLSRAFGLLPEAPREGMRVVADAPRQQAPVDRLRLLFPPPGAALAEGAGPVTLRAAGGRRPLAFLVDGAPVAHEPARREAAWTPPGPGFYRVTVLDAEGGAVSAQVRVRPADAPASPPDIVLVPASAGR
jgi:penicillin-binding protein 1C